MDDQSIWASLFATWLFLETLPYIKFTHSLSYHLSSVYHSISVYPYPFVPLSSVPVGCNAKIPADSDYHRVALQGGHMGTGGLEDAGMLTSHPHVVGQPRQNSTDSKSFEKWLSFAEFGKKLALKTARRSRTAFRPSGRSQKLNTCCYRC